MTDCDCDCYISLFFVCNIETLISENISNYSSAMSTVDGPRDYASLASQAFSPKSMGGNI